MKDTIPINYEIVFDEDKIFNYPEYFVPYSAKEIRNSPFLSSMETDYTSLFAVENKNKSLDFLPHKKVSNEKILPDTANILADFLYCIKAEFSGHEPISNHYENFSFKELIKYENFRKDIAAMTELIKFGIAEIKHAISALVYLHNSDDNIDKNLANSFLNQIKQIHSLEISDFTIANKTSIEAGLLELLHFNNFKCEQEAPSIIIDLKEFDQFTSLFKERHNKKFFIGQKCFCLIREGDKYFFSVSGYNIKNNYAGLVNEIREFSSKNFKNSFEFCEISDEMLSYGTEENDKFVKFPKPIKYKDQKEKIDKKSLAYQYRCCERKIFPYTKNFKQPLYIFCKYEPCENCTLAKEEQEKLRNTKEIHFLALAKDQEDFLERINKGLTLKEISFGDKS
ncbi:hypothetical protein J6Y50_10470 [bacterium]|nr:hypothetical protein [bacterium]